MGYVEAVRRRDRNGDERVVYKSVPWDAAAKKRGPARSFDHESDARNYWRGWERDRDRVADAFGVPTVRNRKRVLFAEYADQFVARADGTTATRRALGTHARAFGARFARLHVDEITRALVNEVLAEMTLPTPRAPRGLSAGTRRNRISFLRRVFAEALRDELITVDPTRDVEMPRRAPVRDHRPPTEEELSKIVDYFDGWFEPAILLAHDCGLRAGEVAGLRWFRIDFERRTVMVADVVEADGTLRPFPKARKALEIPLSARTLAVLRKVKLASGGGDMDFVVRRPGGRSFSGKMITAFWHYHSLKVEGIGTPRPTFHDLRHAACQRLVDAGVDILTVSAIMRHSSLDVTRAYLRAVPMDRMQAAFAAVPEPEPVAAPVAAIAGA